MRYEYPEREIIERIYDFFSDLMAEFNLTPKEIPESGDIFLDNSAYYIDIKKAILKGTKE